MKTTHYFGAIQSEGLSTSKKMIEYQVGSSDETWAENEGVDGITLHLLEYMRENTIGKLIPQPATDPYFTPQWKRGPLTLSIQLNYRLWDLRDDRNQPFDTPMTADEFDELHDSLYDFAAWCDGVDGTTVLREACQMGLVEIAELVYSFFTGKEDEDSEWYEPDDDWDDDWINDYDWDDDDY